VKLHPKYIRKVLQASERFGQEDRRWNLALRTATQLTFEGSIEYTLRSYGKPMSLRAIQNEMAVIHRRSVGFFDTLLTETLGSRPKYWQAPDGAALPAAGPQAPAAESGMWCLREWILDTSDSDPERCFLRNFFLEAAEVRPVVDSLVGTRMSPDQPLADLAIKFIRKAGEPISNKVLSYAMWRLQEGDLNPVDLLQACRQDSRLLMLSGMAWGLQESVEGYFEELKRASKRAEKEEDPGWVEEEEPEGPVVLTPTDLEEALKHLRRRKHPQPAATLVEALFEYSPGSRRFQESVDALVSALSLDSRFVRVGRQTWALPDMMPKHTEKVPEELLPVASPTGEDEVDAELGDEGLEPVLVSWVHDPRYEDFGEESEIEISPDQQPTDELRYVLLYDHWKAGTLKVRVSDRRFYPSDSDLVCATFVDKESRKSYAVWLSYTSSLLYDMGEWYAARKVMPGAVFAVTQGTMPDEFTLSYTGETDPYAALDADRIKALTKLGKEATKESWSVLQIMQKVLSECPEGLPFMRLWAQANVVRRTRRRAVASNLASYHCFYQKPASSDKWVFDERKVTQGRKKTKRKFVRHS
jgi:DNA-directed RNA polymerase delta subunit